MASIRETQEHAANLLDKFGLADAGWHFNWDNSKTRGGVCSYTYRRISMSRKLVPLWTDAQVYDVLIHEVAHALVGPGHGHGAVWAAKMRELGAKPDRCHENETVPGRYLAICDTCNVDVATAHRFTNAMRAGRHIHRACRRQVRWVDTALVSA